MSSDVVVICRACISECVEYKNINKQGVIMGEVTTLAELLEYCTNEFLDLREDFLPVNICMRCVQGLAKCYAFKKMVLESNEFLRKQQEELNCGNGESKDELVEEHHYLNEMDENAEVVNEEEVCELQELATAAQLKRDMEEMQYVSLTNLQEDDEEVEQEECLIEHDVAQQEVEVVVPDTTEGHELYQPMDTEDNNRDVLEIVQLDETSTSEADEKLVKRKYAIELHGSEPKTKPNTKRFVRTRGQGILPKPDNPDLQCQICGKQLSNAHSFKYHLQLHSDKTPFLCSLCGEGFKTRNAYDGHIMLHNPNNPNRCEICGKSYRQAPSLRSHMLTHTGVKPYQCNICNKGFTQKSGYKKHLLMHTGEKPHTCDICNREFRYSSNLNAHRRTHTGERPFECSHCDKTFSSIEQMKRHTLVHTGQRPFNCDLCDKTFKRRSSLVSHRNTHDARLEQKLSKSNVVEHY